MPSYEELFIESKGKPILYKGNTLYMVDYYPVLQVDELKIFFELDSSDWKQGIMLDTDGTFTIQNRDYSASVVFWNHTAPSQFSLKVKSNNKIINVRNIWDTGDGTIHSWHNGAAMIIEQLHNGRRYLCNDGHPDENFTDLIFRIERNL